MRRLFALYVGVILLAAGTGYGSVASNYNHDIATFPSGYSNGWVWINAGPGKTGAMYKLTGHQIEAVLVWGAPGQYWLEKGIWTVLYNNTDRVGQQWIRYATDAYGNPEFRTNDGRLCAKVYWVNGMHTIRVCYSSFISKNGLWRYDG